MLLVGRSDEHIINLMPERYVPSLLCTHTHTCVNARMIGRVFNSHEVEM